MTDTLVLLISSLVEDFLDGVTKRDRAGFTRAQVIIGHVVGGLIVFIIAYVLLWGVLFTLGY